MTLNRSEFILNRWADILGLGIISLIFCGAGLYYTFNPDELIDSGNSRGLIAMALLFVPPLRYLVGPICVMLLGSGLVLAIKAARRKI